MHVIHSLRHAQSGTLAQHARMHARTETQNTCIHKVSVVEVLTVLGNIPTFWAQLSGNGGEKSNHGKNILL